VNCQQRTLGWQSSIPCDLMTDDHPKLDFALGDKLGHDIGVRPRDLRRDGLGDAEAVQQRSQ